MTPQRPKNLLQEFANKQYDMLEQALGLVEQVQNSIDDAPVGMIQMRNNPWDVLAGKELQVVKTELTEALAKYWILEKDGK